MKYKVTLNGKIYVVEVECGEAVLIDEYEACAPAAAPAAAPVQVLETSAAVAAPAAAAAGEVIASPMPGNVLAVNAVAGASVKAGDLLIVLEAMKMENEILAPRDGVVAQVAVGKGAVVNTGDALVVLR